jgi:hypothetical protein
VTDVTSIIRQLEQQKASIDRAIEALREIAGGGLTGDSASQTAASDSESQTSHISPDGRRKLAESMKRRWAARRAAAKKAGHRTSGKTSTAAVSEPSKGRKMAEEQKRAISNAWTPERKQKFAEFHVQRMARERGEDPARALREYRRRKQKETGTSGAQKMPRKAEAKKVAPARKSTGRKTATKKFAAAPAVAAVAPIA